MLPSVTLASGTWLVLIYPRVGAFSPRVGVTYPRGCLGKLFPADCMIGIPSSTPYILSQPLQVQPGSTSGTYKSIASWVYVPPPNNTCMIGNSPGLYITYGFYLGKPSCVILGSVYFRIANGDCMIRIVCVCTITCVCMCICIICV